MRDLEERLGAALSDVAESAPGTAGLADGARRRARIRRRRRTGAVVAGMVAAVVAMVVPLGLVGGGSSTPAPAGDPGPGWQTVSMVLESPREGVEPVTLLVDVPDAWVGLEREGECPFYDYGTPGGGPCSRVEGMYAVADPTNLDHTYGPGLRLDPEGGPQWGGYVVLGSAAVGVDDVDVDVNVVAAEEQVALRVLASARLVGTGALAGLAGPWPLVVEDGVAYRSPSGTPVEVTVQPARPAARVVYADAAEVAPGRWRAEASLDDGRRVVAEAGSEALAELVAGSAYVHGTRPTEAEDWRTVSVNGVDVDVPPEWVDTADGACAGLEGCATGPRLQVRLEAQFSYVIGLTGDGGNVGVRDQLVSVGGVDRATARRILGSARPVGSDPVEVSSWSRVDLGDGVSVEVPDGLVVQVVLLDAYPDCEPGVSPARADGEEWVATACRDRIVTVRAPTQALADVVASSIRGY